MIPMRHGGIADVRREKTAILRYRYSRPVMLALSHAMIAPGTSVFDYGCGHGEDLKHLRSLGITATGWDPHFSPDAAIESADFVNLGYVLNVIEDPEERQSTLLKAYDLARRVLLVAVRVDRSLESGFQFSDGVLTQRGSFQKLYSQGEFRDYLQDVLGKRPHMAALGIAYVFKDEALESSYLASLVHKRIEMSRTYALEEFSQDPVAQSYISLTSTLGRSPIPSEFGDYHLLLERFGSPARIERLAQQLLSPEAIQETQQRRREDILAYAAMMQLQGLKPVPFRSLPQELQSDIRMLWPSYEAVLHEARRFLFGIGDASSVRICCESSRVGKKLPDALYIHCSAEEQLPATLRLLLFAARQVVGDLEYNVAKISSDGRSISFLRYDRFEEDPHPSLQYSVRVYLPRAEYTIRNYSDSANPPLLHRKDLLVDALHPLYPEFRDLSEEEERLGLLRSATIGTRAGWSAVLAANGVAINDHRLVRADTASPLPGKNPSLPENERVSQD
jgi:DNA phosphorothioation-associated putative methyltransferase